MRRPGIAVAALAAALLATAAAQPVRADEHHEGERHEEGRGHEGGHYYGGIERFHERDYHVWRAGHWEHRYHDGRYGWWWLAGGLWYFYPAPVYPDPDPYVPPLAAAAPPMVAPPAIGAPAPQYWYYCESAGGYYPYVPACPSGWHAVPAGPGR